MMLNIYSIFDRAVGAHLQPFFARSEGEAVRMLRQAVNDPNTNFHNNPSDYTLVFHGEFADQVGEFTTSAPQSLINLSSLAATLPPPESNITDQMFKKKN